MRDPLDSITILSVKQVAKMLGLSSATMQRQLHEMPPRYRVSERRLGWRKSDIDDWLAARLQPSSNGATSMAPTLVQEPSMKIAAGSTRAVTVQFTNANGNPAKVQGDVEWTSSDEAVATVAGSGASATITAGPKAGTTQISAIADADLGDGVSEVEANLDVEVIARGEATGGEITPVVAGQGLPGQGGQVDNSLPGQPGRPSNELPGAERPTDPGYGQGAPRPDRPSNELPNTPGGRPDNTTPGAKPK